MSPRRESWSVTPLGELVEILDFARIPVSASERAKRLGSVPYYGATGQVGWIDKPLFDEPLVLLGEDGVQFFDSMKSKAYSISGPAWVNNHAHVLRARPAIDRRYLLHFLNQFDYRGYANGTTRLKLTQAAMRGMPINYPGLEEQQRIIDILEDHLSRLDAAGSSISSTARKLKALRVTSLGALWDRALAVSGSAPIGNVGSIVTGRTPSTRGQDPFGGSIPFLTPSDVGHGDLISTYQRSLNETGAAAGRLVGPSAVVVVCIGATIGKVGWIDQVAASNQQINAVEVDGSLVLPEFLAAAVAAPQFQRQMFAESSSTTMPILNKSKFSRLLVPVPDVGSQRTILDELTWLSEAGSRAAQASAACASRSTHLRQALLMAAFSGRLTSRSSDMELLEEMAGV